MDIMEVNLSKYSNNISLKLIHNVFLAAFPSPQSSQNSSPPNQRVISQTQFAHMKAENKNMIDFGPLVNI